MRKIRKPVLILALVVAIAVILLGFLLFQPKQPPTVTPVHASGTITTLKSPTDTVEVNTFHMSDEVYAKGSGMLKNQVYKIYIIADTTIVDGMAIPSPVTPPVTVTTGPTGAFPPTKIWSAPLAPGNYDIIADCQGVGVLGHYDSGDAIDDEEVKVTAGFFVIPETSLGTIAVILAGSTVILLKRKIY